MSSLVAVLLCSALLAQTGSGDAMTQDEDTIIIIDEGSPPAPGTEQIRAVETGGADDDESIIILDAGDDGAVPGPPASAPPALSMGPSARHATMVTSLSSRLMIDTRFEPVNEDVVEWWNDAALKLDVREGRHLRAVLDAQVLWGVRGRDNPDDGFQLVNAERPHWMLDTKIREGYVRVSSGPVDFRVGALLYTWGKNEVGAAADIINPMDLRHDVLGFMESPRNVKSPVLAADLAFYFASEASVQFVLVPFFEGHAAYGIGHDFSLVTPGSDIAGQLALLRRVDPRLADAMQDALREASGPDPDTRAPSAALRFTATRWGLDMGATAFYGWDRVPEVWVDPDLQRVLGELPALFVDPEQIVGDVALQRSIRELGERVRAGEDLVALRYERMFLAAIELQRVIGDFVVRLDAGFSPERRFIDETMAVHELPAGQGALGVEYTYGSAWMVSATLHSMAVLDPPEHRNLMFIEGAKNRTMDAAVQVGMHGMVRWQSDGEYWEVMAVGNFNALPGDHMLMGRITYLGFEPHDVFVGAFTLDGPEQTLGRNFKRNDLVFVGWRAAF